MKKKHLLGHVADQAAPGMKVELIKRNIIDVYSARLGSKKSCDQVGNRCLTGTGMADDRHDLPRGDIHTGIFQYYFLTIGKMKGIEIDAFVNVFELPISRVCFPFALSMFD